MLAKRNPFGSARQVLRVSPNSIHLSMISTPFQRRCLNTFHSNTPASITRSKLSQLARSIRQQSRSDSTIAAAASPTSTNATTAQQPLTWNRFLQLRKVRRRLNLIASVICAAAALVGGVSYISSDPDVEAKVSSLVGLDPMITMGILTFACGAGGWLLGPTVGSAIFGLRYRSMTKMITEKEKEFFARIKKYRVDPATSSINNPIPDYYGEKIGSVIGYRRWLKDQRAFNLKRQKRTYVKLEKAS